MQYGAVHEKNVVDLHATDVGNFVPDTFLVRKRNLKIITFVLKRKIPQN